MDSRGKQKRSRKRTADADDDAASQAPPPRKMPRRQAWTPTSPRPLRDPAPAETHTTSTRARYLWPRWFTSDVDADQSPTPTARNGDTSSRGGFISYSEDDDNSRFLPPNDGGTHFLSTGHEYIDPRLLSLDARSNGTTSRRNVFANCDHGQNVSLTGYSHDDHGAFLSIASNGIQDDADTPPHSNRFRPDDIPNAEYNSEEIDPSIDDRRGGDVDESSLTVPIITDNASLTTTETTAGLRDGSVHTITAGGGGATYYDGRNKDGSSRHNGERWGRRKQNDGEEHTGGGEMEQSCGSDDNTRQSRHSRLDNDGIRTGGKVWRSAASGHSHGRGDNHVEETSNQQTGGGQEYESGPGKQSVPNSDPDVNIDAPRRPGRPGKDWRNDGWTRSDSSGNSGKQSRNNRHDHSDLDQAQNYTHGFKANQMYSRENAGGGTASQNRYRRQAERIGSDVRTKDDRSIEHGSDFRGNVEWTKQIFPPGPSNSRRGGLADSGIPFEEPYVNEIPNAHEVSENGGLQPNNPPVRNDCLNSLDQAQTQGRHQINAEAHNSSADQVHDQTSPQGQAESHDQGQDQPSGQIRDQVDEQHHTHDHHPQPDNRNQGFNHPATRPGTRFPFAKAFGNVLVAFIGGSIAVTASRHYMRGGHVGAGAVVNPPSLGPQPMELGTDFSSGVGVDFDVEVDVAQQYQLAFAMFEAQWQTLRWY